jgi:hypothetical protein
MKKIVITAAISFLLSGIANAGEVMVKLKGSYFHPLDKAFQDIYGGGIMYGVEASTGILKNLEMWIEGGYFFKKGKLSFTKEETRLQIIPIGGGLRYVFSVKRLNFFSGIGINYYRYREANPIGTVIWGRLGAVGKIGSFFEVRERIMIDFYLNYSYCEMKPSEFRFNVGGLESGIGIGYRF